MPDWLAAIGHNKKNITIKKGQTLFKEGDPVNGIYFVYEGIVKVHKNWNKDKEIILRFASAGDIVGHMGLGSGSTYPITATAVEKTILCYVDMYFFESSLNVNSTLVKQLMRFFANELQVAEGKIKNLVHMPVKTRIAQALLNLDMQFGTDESGSLRLEITRQNLASYSGTVYESLFRIMNELTADGIVEVSGKTITLKDKAALLKIVESEDH